MFFSVIPLFFNSWRSFAFAAAHSALASWFTYLRNETSLIQHTNHSLTASLPIRLPSCCIGTLLDHQHVSTYPSQISPSAPSDHPIASVSNRPWPLCLSQWALRLLRPNSYHNYGFDNSAKPRKTSSSHPWMIRLFHLMTCVYGLPLLILSWGSMLMWDRKCYQFCKQSKKERRHWREGAKTSFSHRFTLRNRRMSRTSPPKSCVSSCSVGHIDQYYELTVLIPVWSDWVRCRWSTRRILPTFLNCSIYINKSNITLQREGEWFRLSVIVFAVSFYGRSLSKQERGVAILLHFKTRRE